MNTFQKRSSLTILNLDTEDGTRYARRLDLSTTHVRITWYEIEEDGSYCELPKLEQDDLESEFQRCYLYDGWLENPCHNVHYHVVNTTTGQMWITQLHVSKDFSNGGYYKWIMDTDRNRIRLDQQPKGKYVFKQIQCPRQDVPQLMNWSQNKFEKST